jgi:hypothetical protein
MYGRRLRIHLLPPPGIGLFHVFLLLNLISSLLGNSQSSNCDVCMHTIQEGSVNTKTLLSHTYYSCSGTIIRACAHNHISNLFYSQGDQNTCFKITYHAWEQWLKIWSIHNPGNLISHTQVFNSDKPVSVFFDACVAMDQSGCGRYRLWLLGPSFGKDLYVKW